MDNGPFAVIRALGFNNHSWKPTLRVTLVGMKVEKDPKFICAIQDETAEEAAAMASGGESFRGHGSVWLKGPFPYHAFEYEALY